MDSQIVVNVKCLVQVHSEDKVLAMRFPPLGLTAYGDDEEEAMSSFKRLFNRFIRTYREKGRIEQILSKSGVEWWWIDEYPKDRPEFEDTNSEVQEANPLFMQEQEQSWHSVSMMAGRDFAIAA